MESLVGEPFEIVDFDVSSSHWEFVAAAADSDYEFEICSSDDGVASLRSSVSASSSPSRSGDRSIDLTGAIEREEEDRSEIGVEAESVVHSVMQDLALSLKINGCDDDPRSHRYGCGRQYRSIVCDGECDEEESDDDRDLDDELVPWAVAGKLGRQRMRKLEKTGVGNFRKAVPNRVKHGVKLDV